MSRSKCGSSTYRERDSSRVPTLAIHSKIASRVHTFASRGEKMPAHLNSGWMSHARQWLALAFQGRAAASAKRVVEGACSELPSLPMS